MEGWSSVCILLKKEYPWSAFASNSVTGPLGLSTSIAYTALNEKQKNKHNRRKTKPSIISPK